MIALLQRPKKLFNSWSENWLKRRLPRTRSLTLNQRRIFIIPTRDGIGFLLMLAAIFVGGINYANSLILGVSFLLVSLFLVSILHTYGNLSGLQVSAGRSQSAFVGEEAVLTVNLSSESGQDYEAIRLDWGKGKPQSVDLIDAKELSVRMLLPMTQRGYYYPPRLKVETRFPLGLLRAWSWIDLDTNCLVYPKPKPNDYPRRSEGAGLDGERLLNEGSDDFDGLKTYVAGDSPRNVAWKTYARTGEMYSKVFVGQEEHEQWLSWEAFAGLAIEERLSRLCYWVVQFSDDGRTFGLRLPGIEIRPRRGEPHRRECLERLACYGLTDTNSTLDMDGSENLLRQRDGN